MYEPIKGKLKVKVNPNEMSLNAEQFQKRYSEQKAEYEHTEFETVSIGDYKEKNAQLSFDLLKVIATKVAPVAAIINTRVNQVGRFTARAKYTDDNVGFKVRLKDKDKEPTKIQQEDIKNIENFIFNCGNVEDKKRDNFDTFIRKIVRDSLICDQVNFELTRDIDNNLQAFYAVDATTIKPVKEEKEDEDGNVISYVQIIDGTEVARFTDDEMAFAVRNPVTDVNKQPYGQSEIEVITRQLTSFLEAEDYNMRFFQQGGMTKGILNIKEPPQGVANRQTLESFKRQWRTQVTGQKGAWKIPVFQLPGELEFINIAQTNGEMVFEKWTNYLINISCAVYQIDPSEINFPNNGGVGGKGSSLFNGDDSKNANSKDKGLYPLLTFIENTINKYIVSEFNDDYVFVFEGVNPESKEKQLQNDKIKTETYLTINEVRQEKGLDPLETGDIIANPYFMQAYMQGGGSPGGDFDFEEYDGEDGGEEDFDKSLKNVLIIEEVDDLKKSKKNDLIPVKLTLTNKQGTTYEQTFYKRASEVKEIVRSEIDKTGLKNPIIIDKKSNKIVSEDVIIGYIKSNPNVPLKTLMFSRFKLKEGAKETASEFKERIKKTKGIDLNDYKIKSKYDWEKANFRSNKLFKLHYNKHKYEFGNITIDEYLEFGRDLLMAEESENIIGFEVKEFINKYDISKNIFCSIYKGSISTLFKPIGGLRYYERQIYRRTRQE